METLNKDKYFTKVYHIEDFLDATGKIISQIGDPIFIMNISKIEAMDICSKLPWSGNLVYEECSENDFLEWNKNKPKVI